MHFVAICRGRRYTKDKDNIVTLYIILTKKWVILFLDWMHFVVQGTAVHERHTDIVTVLVSSIDMGSIYS